MRLGGVWLTFDFQDLGALKTEKTCLYRTREDYYCFYYSFYIVPAVYLLCC